MSQTPEELGQKIKEAQGRQQPVSTGPKKPSSKAGSNAARAGIDFGAAIVVSVILGYWIDRWLGTKPFGIIIFLLLGFAAGFMSIYRAQTRKTDDKD